MSFLQLNPKQNSATTQRVKVNDYVLPLQVGISGQFVVTDGMGQLSFMTVVTGSGSVTTAGNGVDNHAAVFTTITNLSSSLMNITDGGGVTGIFNLSGSGPASLGGFTYPNTDGTTGQFLATDASGILTFVSPASSGISGTGEDNHLVRWDVSNNIQNSTVIVSDSGDMWDFGRLQAITTLSVNGDVNVIGKVDLAPVSSANVSFSGAVRTTFMSCLDGSMSAGTDRCTMVSSALSSIQSTAGPCAMFASALASINDSADECCVVGCRTGSLGGNRCVLAGSTVSNVGNSNEYSGCIGSEDSDISQECTNSVVLACHAGGVTMDGCTSSVATASVTNGTQIVDSNTSMLVAVTGGSLTNGSQCAQIGCNLATMDTSGRANVVAIASSIVNDTGLTGVNSAQSMFGGTAGVRRWLISSGSGALYSTVLAIANPVPDFAEYFENYYEGAITPVGSLVTLKAGNRVAVAGISEEILGVVSSNPSIRAGGADLYWQGTYQQNKWGQIDTSMMPRAGWRPGPDQTEDDHPKVNTPVKSKAYQKNRPYKSRAERPGEWTCVGLLGQVRTRVLGKLVAGDYLCAGSYGIARRSVVPTRLSFMKILSPFQPQRGYAIGLCLIK